MDQAGVLAETAIAGGEADPMLYCLAAQRRLAAGDSFGAVAFNRDAMALAPENPTILCMAGDALRYTGQLREAIRLFDRALARDPLMIAAWYGRALALDAAGDLPEAAKNYRRVAELAPATAPGFAGLASMQARMGEVEKARKNAARAHEIAPQDFGTIMALARCEIAAGGLEQAVVRLEALAERSGFRADDLVMALGMLGDTLDRLGRHEDAFDAYSRANERFAETHAGPNAPPIARELVEAVAAAVSALPPVEPPATASSRKRGPARHIFLLGFPRSGNTLVEQILTKLPGVVTLEEVPTLALAQSDYFSAAGIAELWQADEQELERLRASYWEVVAGQGIEVEGRSFIDMDPFKGAALPLIARLFPDARVIIMRRDPRDVIWSCFRRNFVYSPATYEFSSLPRAARHYTAVMRLIDRSLEAFEIDAHSLCYEDLIRDFDGTTQRLCTFLGLPWTPALRDFAFGGQARPVKTASAFQVRQGLFDGRGQWRNYAAYFDEIVPILQPWIVSDPVAPPG